VAAIRTPRRTARRPQRIVGALAATGRGRRSHHRLCARKDAFTDHATYLGEHFASPTAVAVHNAQVLAKAQELTIHLRTALSTRPIIDQAIGLLRGRTGETADEALSRLRELSQAERTKVIVVGQRLVDQAVHRARGRRTSRDQVKSRRRGRAGQGVIVVCWPCSLETSLVLSITFRGEPSAVWPGYPPRAGPATCG
jgi:hypothetical protein